VPTPAPEATTPPAASITTRAAARIFVESIALSPIARVTVNPQDVRVDLQCENERKRGN
jgi:hypothetical protein